MLLKGNFEVGTRTEWILTVIPNERSPSKGLGGKEVTITCALCFAKDNDCGWILTFQLYCFLLTAGMEGGQEFKCVHTSALTDVCQHTFSSSSPLFSSPVLAFVLWTVASLRTLFFHESDRKK